MQGKAEFDGGIELLECSSAQLEQALFDKTPSISMLVAERDQELVGLASYFATFSTFLAARCLWLDDLFVLPPHRGQGIGRQLMQALASRAEEMGAARIEWTVAASNEAGQRFYRECGASIRKNSLCARLDRAGIRGLANHDYQ